MLSERALIVALFLQSGFRVAEILTVRPGIPYTSGRAERGEEVDSAMVLARNKLGEARSGIHITWDREGTVEMSCTIHMRGRERRHANTGWTTYPSYFVGLHATAAAVAIGAEHSLHASNRLGRRLPATGACWLAVVSRNHCCHGQKHEHACTEITYAVAGLLAVRGTLVLKDAAVSENLVALAALLPMGGGAPRGGIDSEWTRTRYNHAIMTLNHKRSSCGAASLGRHSYLEAHLVPVLAQRCDLLRGKDGCAYEPPISHDEG